MKLIVLLGLGITVVASAQTSKWNFGVHAGLNSSWVAVNEQSVNPGVSLMAGLLTSYQISKKCFLQNELNYLSVKSKTILQRTNGSSIIAESDSQFFIQYITLPLLRISLFRKEIN